MVKNIFKELIIVLLLVLAILLVLGVFLYDYIPMNKVVPKIEQYETANIIQEQIQESINDTQEEMTPIIYEINNNDLKQYEKSKDYQKGKVNPFADTTVSNMIDSNGNTVTTNTGAGTSTETSNSNSSVTGQTNSSSEGSYLPTTGTK